MRIMNSLNFEWSSISSLVVSFGTKLLGEIVVLVIVLWIIKYLTGIIRKMMLKSKMDDSLVPFLSSLINNLLKVLLAISVLGMLGIEMTSFIALIGAVGLAIGMALSGTLQNFAGGVMLLIFKPFKVGDFIEAQGHSGTVKEIQIFNTILNTPDNKVIIIPNGGLSTGTMTNFSQLPTRRVDWTFGIAYGDDVDKAEKVLNKLIKEDIRILKDPEAFVAVTELADSSVNLVVRVWVNSADYWGVFFDMNKKVYQSFDKEGINIPFPQMDVHLDK
jgi:small conductance mechanosensitive channel